MDVDRQAELRRKRLFVLDMDGTFYIGDRILQGSAGFLRKCGETDRSFLFFTNNSSQTAGFYRRKLASMGCDIEKSRIMTSGDVTVDFLKRERPGARVYLMGNSALREEFERAGILLDDTRPDTVVAAFDTELEYRRVTCMCDFIRGGAAFYATHPDLNCPVEGGFIPDCGAICAMLEASTGRRPEYLGKPHRETLEAIISLTGFQKDEIAFVGDRLYTDIAIGAANGVTSVLVLTGETSQEDLEKSSIKPDYVFPSLAELAQAL
ncbi:MAG: HAD-IIA family hydrolase [Clostridia bacterium]|nr:HAD-IIA family hydrolase [Clostridia bacterium]MDR3643475.1 HAD-IIA family hydrolase [Clostridia bacterium]